MTFLFHSLLPRHRGTQRCRAQAILSPWVLVLNSRHSFRGLQHLQTSPLLLCLLNTTLHFTHTRLSAYHISQLSFLGTLEGHNLYTSGHMTSAESHRAPIHPTFLSGVNQSDNMLTALVLGAIILTGSDDESHESTFKPPETFDLIKKAGKSTTIKPKDRSKLLKTLPYRPSEGTTSGGKSFWPKPKHSDTRELPRHGRVSMYDQGKNKNLTAEWKWDPDTTDSLASVSQKHYDAAMVGIGTTDQIGCPSIHMPVS